VLTCRRTRALHDETLFQTTTKENVPPEPLPKDELPAYHVSARGLLAVEYGIKVCRLSIVPDASGIMQTRLAALQQSCSLKRPRSRRTIAQIEKYVTTLLAGSVGRLIRTEMKMGYTTRCTGQVKLQRKHLAKVRNCVEPDTDVALVITVGWLGAVDDGNAIVTLERLWKRANRRLRTPTNRQRLDRLAERLKSVGEMCGREVVNLIG
jgi:hypothetical protein